MTYAKRSGPGRNHRRRSVAAGLLGMLLCVAHARADVPGTAHRYELTAKLDMAKHTVRGTLRLTFRNTSQRPLSALVFHLYLNAFRDAHSVFMRESGGQLRGQDFRGAGSVDLETLTIDGRDALATAERELLPADFTQLRTPLQTPLPPGGTLTIESRFLSRLPPLFARTGYAGDFHMVAQWFPKLAKLEPDGSFAGFPYHALGEFYADFADYRLEVTTPKAVFVGATGSLLEEYQVGGQMVRTFHAPAVHDVAFVACPTLHRARRRLGQVELISLYPPGYEAAVSEHERTVELGLKHYGKRYGVYPYYTLTMVVPPARASGAAGMEYPGMFVTEGSWLNVPGMLTSPSSGILTTAHELAHQWFQGVIASNEDRWPVLDEGLAEWASADLLRSASGPPAGAPFGLWPRFELLRVFDAAPQEPPIPARWPANYYTDAEYGRTAYGRAALALETVRRTHGRARFDRALALYAKSQRFRHPTPADLLRVFDAIYGAEFGTRVVLPLLFEGKASAVHLADVRATVKGTKHSTWIRARRSGEVALPVWIGAYAENGTELTRTAFPADLDRIDTILETKERVAHVVLDPDRALLVDPNTRDQVYTLPPTHGSGWLWRLSTWLGALLGTVGP